MEELLISIDARGVATVTLNRPKRHNAFDRALIANMTSALRKLEDSDDVRVVILTGTGETFCAGADIEWMKSIAGSSFEANETDAAALAELMHTLDHLSKPTIALVHGPAYGGGVGLVACCDIAIASIRASFCLSEVKIGVIPAVISPFVVRAIGLRRARRYIMTAELIFAEQALAIGLVHEVARDKEMPVVRDRILDALLRCAPGAQAEAKSVLELCAEHPLDEELMRETAHRLALRRASPEAREGLNAFLDKRTPVWRSNWNS